MTLAISALTSSGIVLTADSRQTYRNQAGAIRIGSDSAMKLFRLTDLCGVAISGRAFLSEKDQVKDVGFFVNRFAESEKLDGLTTKDITEKLTKSLGSIFLSMVAKDIVAIKTRIEDEVKQIGGTEVAFSEIDGNRLPYSYKDKDGKSISASWWIETVNMIVAGIDQDKLGRAYWSAVPKGITRDCDTQRCGALWVGQTDVLSRIVQGYAPEIELIDFVKDALSKDDSGIRTQLGKLEYIINWGTITLQDAIDFCVLMSRTTENIQRFSDGTVLAPGGIPGVGGEIDIAVITPAKGFAWLKQKKLKSEGSELSLDSLPALDQEESSAT